ncbi:hypothetical protein, partial [Escherichia coli]|uniref:hypothetical protein n=1 Tax=Escherichia coli TaxID=562 RepID=UPI002541BCF8
VPWVRLAQRVPVRFALEKVPGDVTLSINRIASSRRSLPTNGAYKGNKVCS